MKSMSIGLVLWSVAIWAGGPAAAQNGDELFEVVGRYDSGVAHDVEAVGDVLFYAAGSYVVAMDVSDPARPVEIMRRQFGASTGGDLESYPAIAVVDSLAFLGAGKMLHVLDARDPAELREIGSTELSLEITDIHVGDGFTYTLWYSWGMAIADVSDPSSPKETAFVWAKDLNWNYDPLYDGPPSTYNAVTTIDTIAVLACGGRRRMWWLRGTGSWFWTLLILRTRYAWPGSRSKNRSRMSRLRIRWCWRRAATPCICLMPLIRCIPSRWASPIRFTASVSLP